MPRRPDLNPDKSYKQYDETLDADLEAWCASTAGAPAEDGRLHLAKILAVKADGQKIDVPATRQQYADRCAIYPQTQPRQTLLRELLAHVAQICADLTIDGQIEQVRLGANAILLKEKSVTRREIIAMRRQAACRR